MPLISIITVNFNQPQVTCALLDSIRQQDYRNVEVFVVDNGSEDNPEALFRTQYPDVHFIRSEHNLGFAGGNNLALEHTKGDYLFFINNDAELTTGCLARLVSLFDQRPLLGLASPMICYYPEEGQAEDLIQYAGMTPMHALTGRNRTIGQGELERGQYRGPVPTAFAHGAAMMIPRRVLETVGPMSENFFLYYEELDWGERIRAKGFEIWVEPQARVYHKESLTVSQLGPLKTYYLNRNRVLFMRRHNRGWRLGLFYVFLFGVAVPKNGLQYILRGETANLQAYWRGIWWNFKKDRNGSIKFQHKGHEV